MTFRENVAMWLAGYGVALADLDDERLHEGLARQDPLTVFEGICMTESYEKLIREYAVSKQGGSTGKAVLNTGLKLDFMLMVNPQHCKKPNAESL